MSKLATILFAVLFASVASATDPSFSTDELTLQLEHKFVNATIELNDILRSNEAIINEHVVNSRHNASTIIAQNIDEINNKDDTKAFVISMDDCQNSLFTIPSCIDWNLDHRNYKKILDNRNLRKKELALIINEMASCPGTHGDSSSFLPDQISACTEARRNASKIVADASELYSSVIRNLTATVTNNQLLSRVCEDDDGYGEWSAHIGNLLRDHCTMANGYSNNILAELQKHLYNTSAAASAALQRILNSNSSIATITLLERMKKDNRQTILAEIRDEINATMNYTGVFQDDRSACRNLTDNLISKVPSCVLWDFKQRHLYEMAANVRRADGQLNRMINDTKMCPGKEDDLSRFTHAKISNCTNVTRSASQVVYNFSIQCSVISKQVVTMLLDDELMGNLCKTDAEYRKYLTMYTKREFFGCIQYTSNNPTQTSLNSHSIILRQQRRNRIANFHRSYPRHQGFPQLGGQNGANNA